MASALQHPTEQRVPVSATNLLINNRWIESSSGKTSTRAPRLVVLNSPASDGNWASTACSSTPR